MRLAQLHAMHIAFREICEEEYPWIALGNVLNHWWVYAKDRRKTAMTVISSLLPTSESTYA